VAVIQASGYDLASAMAALWLSLATGATGSQTAVPPVACTLSASAAKTELALGETFVVEAKGSAPAGATWLFPEESGSEAVPLRADRSPAGAAVSGTQRYQATVLDVGDVSVEPIEARCRLTTGEELLARSEPIRLRVHSVLSKEPSEQKLADVRPPLPLAVGRAFWIGLSALALVSALLVLWLWRRHRQPRPDGLAEAQRVVSPEAEAHAALALLQQAGHVERGELREFYIALAQVVKRYLERRLAAPVLEMTSSELVAHLRREGRPADWITVVRELTASADQVKFASLAGQSEDARRHLQAAGALVEAVARALAPASSGPGRAA
jgi:hypothetical protein